MKPAEISQLKQQAKILGSKEADQVILEADAIRQANKKLKAASKNSDFLKVADEFTDPLLLKQREQRVRQTLELGGNVSMDELFAKPAIRFHDDYPIVGDFARLLGFSDEAGNIPLVTQGSSYLFEKVGEQFFNANVAIKTGYDKIIEAGLSSPTWSYPARFADAVIKFPWLVGKSMSQNIAAGGKGAAKQLNEFQVHRVNLMADVLTQRDHIFSLADGTPVSPAVMADVIDVFEAGKRKATWLPGGKMADKDYEAVWQKGIETIQAKHGPEVTNMMKRVKADFDQYDEIEKTLGIEYGSRKNYLNHVYAARKGVDHRVALTSFLKHSDLGGEAPKFALMRQFETFDEAVANGLEPVKDLSILWAHRTFAHKRAVEGKKFMEKLAWNYGVPETTKQKIVQLVTQSSNEKARGALQFAKQLGISFGNDDITAGLTKLNIADGVFGVLQHPSGGVISANVFEGMMQQYDEAQRLIEKGVAFAQEKGASIDPTEIAKMFSEKFNGQPLIDAGLSSEDFGQLRRIFAEETKTGTPGTMRDVLAFFEKSGLTKLTPEQRTKFRQAYPELWGNYDLARQNLELIGGRMGETLVSRAGARRLPKKLTGLINKINPKNAKWAGEGHFDEAAKDFWNGVLPDQLVDAVNDSMDTRNALQRVIDFEKSRGFDDPMRSGLVRIAKGYFSWLHGLKAAATKIWPAYHVRNLASGQMQMVKSVSLLGDAINPLSLYETGRVFRDPDFSIPVMKGGQVVERLTRDSLNAEMRAFGSKMTLDDVADMMHGWADTLYVNGMKDAATDIRNKKRFKDSSFGKFGKFMGGIFEGIENFGREHMYIALRKKGWSPSQAAAETNKIMIDYAHGKTGFERVWLNNILFFYSFARGESANTLAAMFTRPGALTSQLHYVNGVAEWLRDENDEGLPPDLEKLVQTARSRETLSRYIGKTKDGTPRVMQSAGIPLEDMARFLNLKKPANSSVGEVLSAVGESARRTATVAMAQVNPILRKPVEMVFNKSLFFDRPLTDASLRKFPKLAKDWGTLAPYDPRRIPKAVMDGLDTVTSTLLRGRDNGDGTYTVDPNALAVMSVLPGVDRAVSTYSAMTKEDIPLSERIMRGTTGIKTLEVDVEKSVLYNRLRQLQDRFQDLGIKPTRKAIRQRQAAIAAQYGGEGDAD
jgi:hypothetical protein